MEDKAKIRMLQQKLLDANQNIGALINYATDLKMLLVGKICPYLTTQNKPCELWGKNCDKCREMYREDEKRTLKRDYIIKGVE